MLAGCSTLQKKKRANQTDPLPTANEVANASDRLDSIVGSAQTSNKKASELIDLAIELSKKANK